MQKIFSDLGVRYSDELVFEKAKVKEKEVRAWKKNREPHWKWMAACFEEERKNGMHPQVELKYRGSALHYGVFAKEDIGTHRYVGEYTGVVRKRRLRMIYGNHYCVEYPVRFETYRKYVIDASKEGNFTRFINHSSAPNLEMRSGVFSDGVIHMIFLAKRLIRKGEELTLHYGKRFWLQTLRRPEK